MSKNKIVPDFSKAPPLFTKFVLSELTAHLQESIHQGYSVDDIDFIYDKEQSRLTVTYSVLDLDVVEQITLLFDVMLADGL